MDGNTEIYLMNADGSGIVRLTSDPADDVQPTWSPDGTQIAFESNRDGNYEIYMMNADGSNQRRITDNPADDIEPSWSAGPISSGPAVGGEWTSIDMRQLLIPSLSSVLSTLVVATSYIYVRRKERTL
jgi:dipeptidyl aminopeptidase/acylaminoacyl peptidase